MTWAINQLIAVIAIASFDIRWVAILTFRNENSTTIMGLNITVVAILVPIKTDLI
ncbi:hypothetical protein OK016_19635 [Vibrio chagasii]|nr:hypothetical protein [Vibrio chagasii]